MWRNYCILLYVTSRKIEIFAHLPSEVGDAPCMIILRVWLVIRKRPAGGSNGRLFHEVPVSAAWGATGNVAIGGCTGSSAAHTRVRHFVSQTKYIQLWTTNAGRVGVKLTSYLEQIFERGLKTFIINFLYISTVGNTWHLRSREFMTKDFYIWYWNKIAPTAPPLRKYRTYSSI